MKICPICKEFTKFHKNKRAKDGLNWDCISCNAKRVKEWNLANPGKHAITQRKVQLKRNYDVTIEQYAKLFEDQLGSCKICGIHQDKLKKKLDVDHCHTTGKIRGLLCNSCNLGLGNFTDNISFLIKATDYLKGAT
jgi:hypothetical protein